MLIKLQQVLEVDVLLVSHILQTVLAMNFGTSLVEMTAHRIVDRISRKTGCFTLIALLLLHPGNQDNLSDDDTPKNAPDCQDTLESIDLERRMVSDELRPERWNRELLTYCGANFASKM